MQFCFIHHAGQPEQQAIRVFGRVVDRFRVGEQDAEPGAELDQVVPVLAGPGQPAHLQPEDQPHPIQGDLGEQPLEPRPAFDRLPALAQVVVDHLDLGPRPAQVDGPVGQGILAGGGFLMVEDLLRRRLPDVDDGGPVEMPGLELGGRGRVTREGGHDFPPPAEPRRCPRDGRGVRRGGVGASADDPAGVGPRSRSVGSAEKPWAGGDAGGFAVEHEVPPWS